MFSKTIIDFHLNECVIVILVLLVNFFQTSVAWFENCDHTVTLEADNSLYINSPYYPKRYPAGSSCRYSIIAPLDYEINIQCNIKIDKTSSQCTSDFMYLSIEGESDLRDSEYFCGDGSIQRKSMFNKLVLAYTSSSSQNAGQFSCLVTSLKQPCDCGWPMQKMRIAGGTPARIHEYPFMTGILHNPSNKVFCGGAIISHNYVLTAAHCFDVYRNYNELSVIVGDHDLRTGSETPYTRVHRVQGIKIHEQYSENNVYNDIALLRTFTIIEWSIGVGPACLPFLYSFTQFEGTKADIVGWGTTSFAGAPSTILMKATVTVISNSQCRNTYSNLINSQICTYAPSKDSCQYDSGGPLVANLNRKTLIGLISYGIGCGTNKPGVNTRLSSYLNWIKLNTGERFCEK